MVPRKIRLGAQSAALTLALVGSAVTAVPLAHAQTSASVPASFVTVTGDGWTIMGPPDWTLTTLGSGIQQLKGNYPDGVGGAITVIHTAVPGDYQLATFLSDFQGSDAMKGATLGQAQSATWRNQPASVGDYTGQTGMGGYNLWLEKGQAWAIIGTVFTTDKTVMQNDSGAIGPALLTFNIAQ